jgi:hypothetical protein
MAEEKAMGSYNGKKGVEGNRNLITAREKIYWLDCVMVSEYITLPNIGG